MAEFEQAACTTRLLWGKDWHHQLGWFLPCRLFQELNP